MICFLASSSGKSYNTWLYATSQTTILHGMSICDSAYSQCRTSKSDGSPILGIISGLAHSQHLCVPGQTKSGAGQVAAPEIIID